MMEAERLPWPRSKALRLRLHLVPWTSPDRREDKVGIRTGIRCLTAVPHPTKAFWLFDIPVHPSSWRLLWGLGDALLVVNHCLQPICGQRSAMSQSNSRRCDAFVGKIRFVSSRRAWVAWRAPAVYFIHDISPILSAEFHFVSASYHPRGPQISTQPSCSRNIYPRVQPSGLFRVSDTAGCMGLQVPANTDAFCIIERIPASSRSTRCM